MQWMMTLTFKAPLDDAGKALIPAERDHVDALLTDGAVTKRYLAADNSAIWLVFEAGTKDEVESLFADFPMAAYLHAVITPLAE